MPINYLPLDPEKFDNYFKKYNIEYDSNELLELLDDSFCKYIDINGLICGRKSRVILEKNICKKHIKDNIKINKRKKDIIYKCTSINRNKKSCQRNVKEPNMKCRYHINSLTSEMSENISLVYKNCKHNKIIEEIEIENINYIEKYRNMEILPYLIDNNFEIKSDGIRKKINTKNKYFTVNIKSNLFIDNNNNNIYGKGLLNLIIYLFDINIKESIKYINKYIYDKKTIHSLSFPSGQDVNLDNISSTSEMLKNKNNILPINCKINLNKIKNYLINKRFIKKEIINEYINRELIYSDNKSNCVFINNKKTFSLSKGITNKKYNKCLGVPDFISYGPFSDTIFLFESSIDALSYIDIYNENKNTLLSTNGFMMIKKVINYVKQNNIKRVYTCFDNDKKGDEYHDIIYKDIKTYNLYIEVIRKKPNYKDFNEDLKKYKLSKM